MERQTVSSSFIKEVGWEDGTLEVLFSNGTTYRYFDVPEDDYTAMMRSASIGGEFHKRIRNTYRNEKV